MRMRSPGLLTLQPLYHPGPPLLSQYQLLRELQRSHHHWLLPSPPLPLLPIGQQRYHQHLPLGGKIPIWGPQSKTLVPQITALIGNRWPRRANQHQLSQPHKTKMLLTLSSTEMLSGGHPTIQSSTRMCAWTSTAGHMPPAFLPPGECPLGRCVGLVGPMGMGGLHALCSTQRRGSSGNELQRE